MNKPQLQNDVQNRAEANTPIYASAPVLHNRHHDSGTDSIQCLVQRLGQLIGRALATDESGKHPPRD
jgi:hypothetical protein